MRRSRTYPSTPRHRLLDDGENRAQGDVDEEDLEYDFDLLFPSPESFVSSSENHPQQQQMQEWYSGDVMEINGNNNTSTTAAALVHNIASFLTLSDAGSLASMAITPADSWAVGLEWQEADAAAAAATLDALRHEYRNSTSSTSSILRSASLSQIETPLTPALVAVSPGATPRWSYATEHRRRRRRRSPNAVDADADRGDDDDLDYTNPSDDEEEEEDHHPGQNPNEAHYYSTCRDHVQRNHPHNRHSNHSSSCSLSVYESDEDDEDEDMEALLRERRRRWAQEKIALAVFGHPRSLRSFCWEAYQAANEIRIQKLQQQQQQMAAAEVQQKSAADDEESPETQIEPAISTNQPAAYAGVIVPNNSNSNNNNKPLSKRRRKKVQNWRARLVHQIVDWLLHSIPISVGLDVVEFIGITVIDTTGASVHITVATVSHTGTVLGHTVWAIWDGFKHAASNPFAVLEAIVSLQFNAMGKTSEVLVSGIQSVATGVGSASSLALHKLSTSSQHPSFVHLTSGTSRASDSFHQHNLHHHSGQQAAARSKLLSQKKLLRKLSDINDAARIVEYRESEDGTGGLTRHAVSKTRRMMHYTVSLRPFLATIAIPAPAAPTAAAAAAAAASIPRNSADLTPPPMSRNNSYIGSSPQQQHDQSWADSNNIINNSILQRDSSFNSRSSTEEDESSPFMCTPQSFPPTPHSRERVIAQRSQMSDDVVFSARDRLRVHGGLKSSDPRTRERSLALKEDKILAVFIRATKESGIELTCGQHIASKVSDAYYYASTRSSVSILRNCFVYFELSVLPRPDLPCCNPVATLSVGLSTAEMPPNTLVGAWQGSVGICTTGQMLMAGQWCSPANPSLCAYGVGDTVGCLVCLDDESAFETWDGVMVKAKLRFNVNGIMVSPPISTLPMSGGPPPPPPPPTMMGDIGSSLGSTARSSGGERSASLSTPTPNASPPQHLPPSTPPPSEVTLHLLVPAAEELYPTVTLQSSATSVACRFSGEDVLATAREVIGAPAGVAVYGVDGSVILREDED